MSDESSDPLIVVDTNVLLNLATPVVDGRTRAPAGQDSLKAVLTAYDVHVPSSVLSEVSEASLDSNLLSAAADAVLEASHHLTTHDVNAETDEPLAYGLDEGESHGIWLANELHAEMFVTDEFNTTNYLFINLALEDRNILFTTPHILCTMATHNVLPVEYVEAALTYYVETKHWDRQYVTLLRQQILTG